jgi:hypothetical protein
VDQCLSTAHRNVRITLIIGSLELIEGPYLAVLTQYYKASSGGLYRIVTFIARRPIAVQQRPGLG